MSFGGLIRFAGSCATSSLNGSLSSKSSWLLTFFDFFYFNSNLINCSLVSLSRSFFSIFSIPILFGLVFRLFFGRVTIWSSLSISILYGLVFKPFLGRVINGPPYPHLYYMLLSLSPFWVMSLYGSPYPYAYYMVLSLSPFWVESLCSYPFI